MISESNKDIDSQIELAARIRRSMAAWNAMSDQQRETALKAANTAVPADAMRHLGYDALDFVPAATYDKRAKTRLGKQVHAPVLGR
jgi:hypothetical protein